jgi:hypothetical protein
MYNYTIYDYFNEEEPLYFSEVFADAAEFVEKVQEVGGDSENLEELYYILANKYSWARTRYMDEVPLIISIKRELAITWPVYLKRKEIITEIYALQIEDLQLQIKNNSKNLSNTVSANNSPVVNADTVPISNKSNLQVSNIGSNDTLIGKLDALLRQYDAIKNDYLQEIYDKMDPLFRTIL